MNLQTYLMIKSAYYNGMEKDATSMEQRMRSAQKKKDMKALDRAAKKGVRGPATEEAIERQPNRAATLGVAPLGGIESTANTIPASFITSESVNSPMYTDSINVGDDFSAAGSPISATERELDDYRRGYDRMRRAFDAADNVGMHNESEARRLADLGKQYSSYAGAGTGALVGGVGGYAGSKWLAKKLGLTGRKAKALKLLGAGTGAALLGTGGYYGGKYLGGRAFKPNIDPEASRRATLLVNHDPDDPVFTR